MKASTPAARATVVLVAVVTALSGAALATVATGLRSAPAPAPAVPAVPAGEYGDLPLSFEPNVGQAPAGAAYLARGRGFAVSVEPAGATLALGRRDMSGGAEARLHLALVDAEEAAPVSASAPLPGRVNHFVGRESQWRSDIPTFGRVTATSVYPGVDVVWYGTGGNLEYDFVVAPGADPGAITMAFSGQRSLRLGDDGALVIDTGRGEVVQRPPVAYQDGAGGRNPVAARYVIDGDEVRMTLGAHDPSRPLVIDPLLVYSTYLGGTGEDTGEGIAVDAAGNALVVGYTTSANFPVANARQPTSGGGGFDAYVTKLNAAGTAAVYSTYLGGTGADGASAVTLDPGGNAAVVGTTGSGDFPTAGPVQANLSGVEDAFVTRLSPAGALVSSTYLGGTDSDQGEGIAVDGSGGIYLAGSTFSSNFPTANPIQATRAGDFDAFVAKLNSSANALMYSTYLGGTGTDGGASVGVDGSGNAVVTGYTFGGFPVANAAQPLIGGASDGFVAKVNPAGTALAYSTYLGGGRDDEGRDVAVDVSGNAYVTGYARSNNFPTVNAYDSDRGGTQDAFVAKYGPTGARVFATFLGGTLFTGNAEGGEDEGFGIAVDGDGKATVTGLTESSDFPVVDPVQAAAASFQDAFVTRFNAAGSALEYSTYLGGSGVDEGHDVAVHAGSAFVTGRTRSPDPVLGGAAFPTTPGAFQPTQVGTNDTAFVAKLGTPAPRRRPVADFDGDGDTDVGVFRPATGTWFVQGGLTTAWGTNGDIPVPGDYDGDGDTDVAVFRPATGTWFVQGGPTTAWGTNGDIPVPGDYDGDGDTDVAVFRPATGTWFVQGGLTTAWGTNGDIPVPGDYDGDGDTDVAVFRPATGTWFVQGGLTTAWGTNGDIPVPADYDGDGDTDVAVFRPATGTWFVQGGVTTAWGTSGDIPVPGDYDGDGDTDVAVFRPSTGTWFVQGGLTTAWGTNGDAPLSLPSAIRLAFFP